MRVRKNYNVGINNPMYGSHRYGKESSGWKGGKYINKLGYVVVHILNHPYSWKNRILEHRLIMEKYLGRYLKPKEIIHHINGIRNDNRLENLEITNLKDHHNIHYIGTKLSSNTKNKIREKHKLIVLTRIRDNKGKFICKK